MKLYYGSGTCALAPHIALEEAGAAYEGVRIDLAQGDQRKPDYLAINPKGRVPALVTDRGTLTEAPAILLYVAQAHPAAGLAPLDDPFQLAHMQAFNAYLCATVHVAHAHGVRGSRWADEPSSLEDMKRKLPESLGACYEIIEKDLPAGAWVLGPAYSVADPYLFTISRWMPRDGVDIARFPKIADHQRRMLERPAVQRALEQHGIKM